MNIFRTSIIAAIMLITGGWVSYLDKSAPQEINLPLSAFPMEIGNWKGVAGKFDAWVYDKVGVDDSILAHYQDDIGTSMELYVGYYKSQREGGLSHSPRNCMVGSGWNISKIKVITIPDKADLHPMQAVCLEMVKASEKELVLYWYYERGRIITSEYHKKYYLILDALTRKRTDGALIRLISRVSGSEEAALEKMTQFASELFPILKRHIPA